MKKWACFVTLALSVAGCAGSKPADTAANEDRGLAAVSEPAAAETTSTAQEARFTEITIPSGTLLRLELKSAVGSDTSKVEQPVRAALRQPVTIDGRVALPAGSEVSGVVTDVERSGRVKGLARIAYRFGSVRANGESYEMKTASISHEAQPTKKQDAEKIAIGAGAGAALGALLGGGDGAAKGAAIGGAGGTGVVLATRGNEVHVGPGASVTTRLTAPLIVRVGL